MGEYVTNLTIKQVLAGSTESLSRGYCCWGGNDA